MKQRLYWGLTSTLMLLVILAFASFAEVIVAWNAFTNAKDAYELAKGAVNFLTGEKETLEGQESRLKAELDEAEAAEKEQVDKLEALDTKIREARGRVYDAQVVVDNCDYQIETAERGISYYQRRLDGTVSGSEASRFRASLEYWRKQKTYWTSERSSANYTLSMEKMILSGHIAERIELARLVRGYKLATQGARNRWGKAKALLANRVSALEVKQAELDAKTAEMQMAISNLQSALANLSTRMDANEQLDAKQQQQIDSMQSDIDRILEHLGIE